MNVLLTDVSSPSPAMPMAETTSDSSNDGFHSMMQKNLKPESKSEAQLIENKEISVDLDTSTDNVDLAIESALIPDFWIEHLAMAETELTTEPAPTSGPASGLAGVVSIAFPAVGKELPVIGESLPVNGNPLPSTIEQSQLVGSVTNTWVRPLQQGAEQKSQMQDLTKALNTSAATSDTVKLDVNSNLTSNDLLDQLTAKSFESSALLQSTSDSSNARLQAAMSAINGLQNPMTNPATANPVASSSVLANSLDRLVMTNPESAAEWGKGIGERVSVMLNQKQNAATIRLDPPMLGKMDIQIQIRDDITSVTINTQHAQTRDMVDSASYRLKEFLQDAGYENVNVDVSHQSDQQKNDAQFMSDADTDDSKTDTTDSGQSIEGDNMTLSAQVTQSNSLVDYFA